MCENPHSGLFLGRRWSSVTVSRIQQIPQQIFQRMHNVFIECCWCLLSLLCTFFFFWMRDFTLLMTWGCYSHIQWSGTGGNIHWFKWNKSTYTSYKLLSSGWMRVQLCLMDACFYLKSYCVCLTSFPLPDSFSLAQWPTFLWPTFYSQPKRTQDVLTAFKRTSVKPSSWPRSSPLVNLLLSNLLWS